MKLVRASQTQHSQKIADELIHFLADTYALYLKTQNFHWNVTGPNFQSLHQMFDEQYKELAGAVDLIAERIRALDAFVPASFAQFSKFSSLKEETHHIRAEDMLKKLLRDHETIVHHAFIILEKAEKTGDEGTVDLLIERIRSHEKTAWMLKSSIA